MNDLNEQQGKTSARQELDRGIYAIVCEDEKGVYVGSSKTSIKDRWRVHRQKLQSGKHLNPRLQAAHDKFGADALGFFVLETIASQDNPTTGWQPDPQIRTREAAWQNYYRELGYQVYAEVWRPTGINSLKTVRAFVSPEAYDKLAKIAEARHDEVSTIASEILEAAARSMQ